MNHRYRSSYSAPEAYSDRTERAAGEGLRGSDRRQYAGGSAPLRLFVGSKEQTPKDQEGER